MKQALYNKLKEKTFENTKSQVPLQFSLAFEVDDQGKKEHHSLCETCYVHFNDHIGKNHSYYNIIYYISMLVPKTYLDASYKDMA